MAEKWANPAATETSNKSQIPAIASKTKATGTETPAAPESSKVAETPETKKKGGDENVVFIGQKPFMNYVTAVVTQFKTKKEKEVIIKARGKFISRAVDVAEVSAKRFLKEENIKVKGIKIDSEEFENKEGRRINVSTIDITLEKTG